MRNKAISLCFLMVVMLIFTACTDAKGPIQTQVETSNPNISEIQDFTSDCSKVLIPSNVERDTNLDIEKGLLTVYWFNDSKGKDVGVVFRYRDKNCSESAKQIVLHLLDSEKPPAGTPAQKYISQDVALDIAKKTYQESAIIWETTMIENKEIEINNKKKTVTVWDVTATYLAGNKRVVEIDAETGVIILETEIEAEEKYIIGRLDDTIDKQEAEKIPPNERWHEIKDLKATIAIDVLCDPFRQIVDQNTIHKIVDLFQDSKYVEVTEYPKREPDVKLYFRKKDGYIMAGRFYITEGIINSPEGPLIKIDSMAVKLLMENTVCEGLVGN